MPFTTPTIVKVFFSIFVTFYYFLSSAYSLSGQEFSISHFDSTIHNLVDQKQLAGAQYIIYQSDSTFIFDSYGFSDIELEKRLDKTSLFRIFSMTKPIVSVAIFQLIEEGKIKLEDPLAKYLPYFSGLSYIHGECIETPSKKSILIKDLLRHTSGIGYEGGSHECINDKYRKLRQSNLKTNEEFCKALAKIPLNFSPGSEWQYGFSTNILGHVIEVVSGKPLGQYLKDQIFDPLGMNSTFFQVPKSRFEDMTVGYGYRENQGLFVAESSSNNRYTANVTLFNGGGGLISTAQDYLLFCKMLLNRGSLGKTKILSEESIDIMTQNQLPSNVNFRGGPSGGDGFGYGFSIGEQGDYGWGGAVGTYFRVCPDKGLIMILMIQRSPHQSLDLRNLMFLNVYNSF